MSAQGRPQFFDDAAEQSIEVYRLIMQTELPALDARDIKQGRDHIVQPECLLGNVLNAPQVALGKFATIRCLQSKSRDSLVTIPAFAAGVH